MDSVLHLQSSVPFGKYLELYETVKGQRETIVALQEAQLDQAQRLIDALATIAYVGIMDYEALPSGTLSWLKEIRGDDPFDEEI